MTDIQKLNKFKFKFGMTLSKAHEESGKKYVDARVSDTRLDFHTEHMIEKSLQSMEKMLKEGSPQPNGDVSPVLLLPDHSSTFEMGYGRNGWIQKGADGALELYASFELIDGNPHAEQLYSEVQAGTCKKQLSVGGEAMGHTYWDPDVKMSKRSLDDVVLLEHVACTRANRAAVSSTGFVGAMLKSLEGLADAKPLEKAALTDSERKKSATIVLDNSGSQTMFIGSNGKLYLLPIPDGDTNAAKVALQEMHDYPLTRQQKKSVHDRAAAVLGDEHKKQGYCHWCSSGESFLDGKGDLALQKHTDTEKDTESGGAGGDDNDMDKETLDAINKALTDLKTDINKSYEDRFNEQDKLLKSIAEKAGIDTKPKTEGELLIENLLKGVEGVIEKKFETFRKEAKPRQGGDIPTGSQPLIKGLMTTDGKPIRNAAELKKAIAEGQAAGAGEGTGEEEDGAEGGEQGALIKSIEDKLAPVQEKMDEFAYLRKSATKFTPEMENEARRTADTFRHLQTQLRSASLGVAIE